MSGLAEQVGRMKSWQYGKHRCANPVLEPTASEFHDSVVQAEYVARRHRSKHHEHLWRREFNVAAQKWNAERHFAGIGIAIVRWTPRHDVDDVDMCPIQADRRQHLVEKLSGASDKGQAGFVFVVARRFADKQD